MAPPLTADLGTEDTESMFDDCVFPEEQLQGPAERLPEPPEAGARPEARPARARIRPGYLRDYILD